jgi:hypothetical protein
VAATSSTVASDRIAVEVLVVEEYVGAMMMGIGFYEDFGLVSSTVRRSTNHHISRQIQSVSLRQHIITVLLPNKRRITRMRHALVFRHPPEPPLHFRLANPVWRNSPWAFHCRTWQLAIFYGDTTRSTFWLFGTFNGKKRLIEYASDLIQINCSMTMFVWFDTRTEAVGIKLIE